MSFSIGIALGGGAARGLAHIGVLEELIASEIPLRFVSGTSVGAMVGAIFARRGRVDDVKQRVSEFVKSPTFKEASLHMLAQKEPQDEGENGGFISNIAGLLRKGLLLSHGVTGKSIISYEEYEAIMRELVEDVEVESFKIPFAAVAADLVQGREVVFTKGSARHAVMASSAIPGVFPPVCAGEKILVDGGWINAVPVSACRELGADFVIAVDISADLEEQPEFGRSLNVFLRSNTITRVRLKDLQLDAADFVIKPDVGDIHWADFSDMDGAIELGRNAAKTAIPSLMKKISSKRLRRLFRLK